MGLRKSLRYLSLIVFMLLLMPEHWAAAAADESDELVPRLGETTAEFEARVKGLPRPPSSDSVTLVADSLGHFFVEPIVNAAVTAAVETDVTSDPKCARMQADGVPCDRPDADCDACEEGTRYARQVRETRNGHSG